MRRIVIVCIVVLMGMVLFFDCKNKNKAPDTPAIPTGPVSGIINMLYYFSSVANDPDGDSIAIRIDWGDEDTSEWNNFLVTGTKDSINHSWSAVGSYGIRAQAKDIKGKTSAWSSAYNFIVSKGGWTKTYGGAYNDVGNSVLQADDGGYVICGVTTSFSSGDAQVYLIKTDSDGNMIWQKTFGTSSNDFGYWCQKTSDNGYIITGYTDSSYNVILIKTDGNGNQEWFKVMHSPMEEIGYSVQQVSDGGYAIFGTRQFSDWTGYYSYALLMKTDANGDTAWTRNLGTGYTFGYFGQKTNDGGYVLVGMTYDTIALDLNVTLIKTNANGVQSWIKFYGSADPECGYVVEQTNDGGYIITGYKEPSGMGIHDVYVIKTDASGNLLWSKSFGGAGDEVGWSVHQTSDQGYIISGRVEYIAGWYDIYLIKTDASGNLLWSKLIGEFYDEQGFCVQQTTDGGYIITGYTESSGAGWADVYLVKTDECGNATLLEKIPKLFITNQKHNNSMVNNLTKRNEKDIINLRKRFLKN